LAKAILNREHGGAGNVLLLDEPGNDLRFASQSGRT
jgi:ATPase subunit of ABC transporter with duplicated ATPase domains